MGLVRAENLPQELARALTGWNYSVHAYGGDQGRYEGTLIPETWAPTHDRGAKLVLGSPIAAGGNPTCGAWPRSSTTMARA